MPSLRTTIEDAPNVMSLWIEFNQELEAAYDARPPDEERIRAIYRYALWALQESGNDDVVTAVVVAFFEHLPTRAAVRDDVYRWFSPEVFCSLEAPFRYFLSEEEFVAFRSEYQRRRAAWAGGRR